MLLNSSCLYYCLILHLVIKRDTFASLKSVVQISKFPIHSPQTDQCVSKLDENDKIQILD